MNIMQLTQTMHLMPPVSARAGKATKAPTQPVLPGLEPEKPRKVEVTNRQVAEVLANIADILELQHSNLYRIQAYRNAARGILALEESASVILARGEPLPVQGLGKRLRTCIAELVETGTMTFYNDLCVQALPRGVRALLAVPFVGIQTAIRLYQELEIDSPEKLWEAAHEQRIRKLYGFGPRSEARLQLAAEHFMRRKSSAPSSAA
ncbi:MAG TPA: helix-hairpin-helix domain-containing protein [Ktedonobacteraceae bacterium]